MRIAVALIAVLIAVLLAGCETLVPVAPSWPKLPEQSDAARPCAELAPIKAEPVLSEISKTINDNYGAYWLCANKVDTWIAWYNEQKKLYESKVKKP